MTGEPLCILLVEDNPDHAELALRNLEESKLANKVFHVEDGEAALDFLHRRNQYADEQKFPRPHLVLLDLRLPKIDGLEVLKQIKTSEELQSIPVVVLTTSTAERDIAMAYQYHANSYVSKPVDFDTFSQLLRDLDYYWLAWNKRPW
ncbi:response regulator [Geomesophilobacter sediminis]|uniref:Response regulator n=1 Tax=Geomesophilobacter sediminis TaxID=2798584 RepID=A0A8J7JKS0_9BACT|nr:response regulator [Geomesophilobacter sediminis]MBJ6724130.1 response regulator [Geomesophilobacter sediminis]